MPVKSIAAKKKAGQVKGYGTPPFSRHDNSYFSAQVTERALKAEKAISTKSEAKRAVKEDSAAKAVGTEDAEQLKAVALEATEGFEKTMTEAKQLNRSCKVR